MNEPPLCTECGGSTGDRRCPHCGASDSLPLGMDCPNHRPVGDCGRCHGTGYEPDDASPTVRRTAARRQLLEAGVHPATAPARRRYPRIA